MLQQQNVSPEIVIRSGEPFRQILAETTANDTTSRSSARDAKGVAGCIGGQRKLTK